MSASGIPADYVPGFICHLGTCNITEWGYVHYQPSVPGNVLFLLIINSLGLAQLLLGIYHKTGLVCVAMVFGLASESSGYIARILLHYNPFSKVYFMWYLICLTLGPVFIAAAIYICLGRIVIVYGEEISRIKPRSYTIFFMGCDFIALCVQTVGGAIAASAPITNRTMLHLGTHILVAGLSFQVASLFAFSMCSLEFLWRVHRHHELRNSLFADLYNGKRFKWFLCSLFLATTTLFVRTVFRAIELSEGFGGKLANNQLQFMILDGAMVIIATICMTVMHPGFGFEKRWNEARFSFFDDKAGSDQEIQEVSPAIATGTDQEDIQAVADGNRAGDEKVEPNVPKIEMVHEVKE